MGLLLETFFNHKPSHDWSIVDQGTKWSRPDFERDIRFFTDEFRDHHISPGSKIIILGPNSVHHLSCLLACSQLDLVYVPVYDRASSDEIKKICEEVKPHCIVTLSVTTTPQFTYPAEPGAPIDEMKTGGVLFSTSGSTSSGRYIFQSQRDLLENAERAAQFQKIDRDSIIWSCLTLSHTGGLNMQVLPALLVGAQLIMEPSLNALSTLFCTHMILVPAQWRLLKRANWWRSFQFSGRPLVLTGSSPVPEAFFDEIHLKGARGLGVYGLTEVGPFICVHTGKKHQLSRGLENLLGRPLPPYVFDLAPGTNEILIRGPGIGRLFDPLENKLRSLVDKNGWLHTGDISHKENGYYYFIGRLKLMINVGGLKVSSSEIEQHLLTCEGVDECLVVPAEHEFFGQVPHAYIVGTQQKKKEIDLVLRKKLSSYKIPRKLFFVKQLPRTSIGKNVYRTWSAS